MADTYIIEIEPHNIMCGYDYPQQELVKMVNTPASCRVRLNLYPVLCISNFNKNHIKINQYIWALHFEMQICSGIPRKPLGTPLQRT